MLANRQYVYGLPDTDGHVMFMLNHVHIIMSMPMSVYIDINMFIVIVAGMWYQSASVYSTLELEPEGHCTQ